MAPKLQHIRSATLNDRPDPLLLAEGQIALNYPVESAGLFFKDSVGGLVKAGPCHIGATAPNSTPVGSAGNSVGEAWLDITDPAAPILKHWDGVQWLAAVTAASNLWTDIGGSLAPTGGGGVSLVGTQKLTLGYNDTGANIYYEDGYLNIAPRPGFHTVLRNGFLGIGTVPTTALHSDLAGFGIDYSAARFSYGNLYGGDFGGGIETGVGGYARISVLNGGEPVPQLTIHPAKAQFNVALLAGAGTEMVVADDAGNLTRQAIGSGPQGPEGPQGPAGPAGADSVVPGPAGADGAAGPPGPTAVSADAGNTSTLGTDGLIYTPAPVPDLDEGVF